MVFSTFYQKKINYELCRGIAPHLSTLMTECHIKNVSEKAPAPHGVIDFDLVPMMRDWYRVERIGRYFSCREKVMEH